MAQGLADGREDGDGVAVEMRLDPLARSPHGARGDVQGPEDRFVHRARARAAARPVRDLGGVVPEGPGEHALDGRVPVVLPVHVRDLHRRLAVGVAVEVGVVRQVRAAPAQEASDGREVSRPDDVLVDEELEAGFGVGGQDPSDPVPCEGEVAIVPVVRLEHGPRVKQAAEVLGIVVDDRPGNEAADFQREAVGDGRLVEEPGVVLGEGDVAAFERRRDTVDRGIGRNRERRLQARLEPLVGRVEDLIELLLPPLGPEGIRNRVGVSVRQELVPDDAHGHVQVQGQPAAQHLSVWRDPGRRLAVGRPVEGLAAAGLQPVDPPVLGHGDGADAC